MTRNEFILETAQMILNDWRKAYVDCPHTLTGVQFQANFIAYYAFTKARDIANDFYKEGA